ncbi:MAG: hypothetical protein IKR50_10530 [Prevotella sp.]|nr:hypothetical protein [Prevotella sp.]
MMKKQILLFAISLLLPAMPMHAAEKVLILTGGQSNTDGRLYAETLPAYLQSANTNCLASVHQPYTESRLGQFVAYYPTSGTSGQPARWAYDAVTYYYIGQALNEPFYVAKTSYGGTSIDPSVNNSPSTPTYPFLSAYGNGYHWSADADFLAATDIAGKAFTADGTTYEGQSLLKAWIANIDAAIDAITAAGDTPDIKAIIWHQGESDRNVGSAYYANLKAMLAYLRSHLTAKTGLTKYNTLPFFCGTVPQSSSQYNTVVEKALYQLQDEDANFHVVDLRDLTLQGDNLHFNAAGAELFGKRLYNSMVDEGVIMGSRLDDVKYAQADHSNFGTDQYVGAEKTWTFEGITSDIQTSTTIIDALYLHSNNMNGRRFLSAETSEGSVSFADGTVQPVSRTLTTATGANGWTVDKISDNTNASTNMQVAVAANTLYPGRFSMMVSAPKAAAETPTTIQLIFNGKVVAEKAFTNSSEIYELRYDAATAGTYFMHSSNRCMMYAVRYVPTEDRSSQRTVRTDADGYATFGNLSGANLSLPAGLSAWAVAPDEDAEMLTLTQLSAIDKGAGVLLQGAANTDYVLPFSWTASGFTGNNYMTAQLVTGTVEETSGADFVNYLFADKQFTKADGTVSLAAGKAYLSLSNGEPQTSHATLTFDYAVAYDYVDYAKFGTDEIVYREKTWLCQDLGFPSSYSDYSLASGCNDGLYYNGTSGSSNRSWKSATQGTGTYTFADGTKVTVTKTARSSGANSLPSVSASTTASATLASDFAINAAVPGTFSILRSGASTGSLYFNGTKVAEVTTSGDTDMKELNYTSTVPGTFVYLCTGTSNVAALRFVPANKKAVYQKVTNIGWATMSLPYPAKVPAGAAAYYVSDYEDSEGTGTLTLTTVPEGSTIPAFAGFLFNGVKGLYCLEKTDPAADWTSNKLVGTASAALTGYDSTTATDPIYVLASLDENTVGFKKFSGSSIDQYKAYLQLGTTTSARAFRFFFGDATAIQPLTIGNVWQQLPATVYSLDGRQLPALQKGINIVRTGNGSIRKIIVK